MLPGISTSCYWSLVHPYTILLLVTISSFSFSCFLGVFFLFLCLFLLGFFVWLLLFDWFGLFFLAFAPFHYIQQIWLFIYLPNSSVFPPTWSVMLLFSELSPVSLMRRCPETNVTFQVISPQSRDRETIALSCCYVM